MSGVPSYCFIALRRIELEPRLNVCDNGQMKNSISGKPTEYSKLGSCGLYSNLGSYGLYSKLESCGLLDGLRFPTLK